MILVDSSVWIDYFNGHPTKASEHLDSLLGTEHLIVGDLVLTEVLQGFKRKKDFDTAKRLLMSFDVRELSSVSLAIKSAENFRALRAKGVTVRKTIDVIIATFCIEHQVSLLQADKDFLPFQDHLGLRLLPSAM
ncbi:PIN domain nuclease [Simiduia curdlanivorans]|uniref:PIN domain nuclease n=1 Tax=Simiduia curdlanivorans TaxID=1492769 RepID=A0ABV8V2V6_9GAMM|nr:PIN domain nuclease [Simiduia curdlanivorans]MDN3637663.1 PIN domain nuclease [Simiduia curdlanivorans]